jgi:hypothetical protein
MKTYKEFSVELNESYAIKHKKSNKVLSTHPNEQEARDAHAGIGDTESEYKIVKTLRTPKEFSVKEAYMSSDRSKRIFKARELQGELGHEVEPRRSEPAEPHAVHINGRKWRTFPTKSHATNVAKKIAGATVVKESLDEAADFHDQAQEHKKKSDKAMDKNDMEAYHHHMSNYHEALGQWEESKGRSSNAQKHYDKAEGHHELSIQKSRANESIEEIDELSSDLLARYKKKAGEAATAADAAGKYDLGHKRFKGILKATFKQFNNDKK